MFTLTYLVRGGVVAAAATLGSLAWAQASIEPGPGSIENSGTYPATWQNVYFVPKGNFGLGARETERAAGPALLDPANTDESIGAWQARARRAANDPERRPPPLAKNRRRAEEVRWIETPRPNEEVGHGER